MGKSTVAAMFADCGVPVFDADAVVRAMQGPDGSLLAAIAARFPGTVGPGGVDRPVLGARVFGDADALADLETIVHPAVARAEAAFLAAHSDADFVVLDIPLLFEKGGVTDVDAVVVVSAPSAVQRARVLARPAMTADTFAAVSALQMPDAEKRARADFTLDTGAPLAATRAAVAALAERLRALATLPSPSGAPI